MSAQAQARLPGEAWRRRGAPCAHPTQVRWKTSRARKEGESALPRAEDWSAYEWTSWAPVLARHGEVPSGLRSPRAGPAASGPRRGVEHRGGAKNESRCGAKAAKRNCTSSGLEEAGCGTVKKNRPQNHEPWLV